LGGIASFTVDVDGASTNATSFSNLAPGNYFYRVRDSSVPSATANISVLVAERYQWHLFDQEFPFRPESDAYISVAVAGGTGPFHFRLSNSTLNITQSHERFTMPSAGLYDIFVVDAFGCRKSAKIRVLTPRTFSS
jgi:hypothetical protein